MIDEWQYKTVAEYVDIGKNETRMVFGSKVLVIIVLVVATLLCGAGAYGFTVRSEQEIFVAQVRRGINETPIRDHCSQLLLPWRPNI